MSARQVSKNALAALMALSSIAPLQVKRVLLAPTLPVHSDGPQNKFRPVTIAAVDVDDDPFLADFFMTGASRTGAVSPNACTADSPSQQTREISWKDLPDPATSSGVVMPGFDSSSMYQCLRAGFLC